jgi:hypothetical protein
MRTGTVFDVRTGEVIARDAQLELVFKKQVGLAAMSGQEVCVVHGRCTMKDSRRSLDHVDELEIPRLLDRRLPKDSVIIFGGTIKEYLHLRRDG